MSSPFRSRSVILCLNASSSSSVPMRIDISATEIVYALGLGDDLVGVTDECDFPPEAVTKPVVSRSALPQGRPLSALEIDQAVRGTMDANQPLSTCWTPII
jgi:hypothetical protein